MPTSVRLDAELDQMVEAVASRTGQTRSDVIRRSVRSYCERVLDGLATAEEPKSLYDKFAHILESAPADPNAPADLSTNKKYMEGFAAEHASPNHR